jgi:hypothetical protein
MYLYHYPTPKYRQIKIFCGEKGVKKERIVEQKDINGVSLKGMKREFLFFWRSLSVDAFFSTEDLNLYIVSIVIDLVYILLPTQLPTCTYTTILLPSIGNS